MTNIDLANKFMDAVGRGDEAAARACMQPDAEICHNFDNVTQRVDEHDTDAHAIGIRSALGRNPAGLAKMLVAEVCAAKG